MAHAAGLLISIWLLGAMLFAFDEGKQQHAAHRPETRETLMGAMTGAMLWPVIVAYEDGLKH